MFADFGAILKNTTVFNQPVVAKFGLLFSPTSGHTAGKEGKCR